MLKRRLKRTRQFQEGNNKIRKMMQKRFSILWFIMGLGSMLQVVYSLSISEILVLILAPVLMFKELYHMRRLGVMPLFNVAVFLIIGCIASLIVNHAEFYQAIRGLSVTCIILSAVIVGHYMLRNNPQGLKWYFIGAMISGFVCIFVFQRSVEVTVAGGADVDAIMSGKIFWIQRLSTLVLTPLLAFYLRMPVAYCIGAPIFLGIFSILTSTSGRAASLGFLGAAAVVLIGGKKRNTMTRFGRHFALIFCCAVGGILLLKSMYQWAALNDYLGDEARTKYEQQTAGGTGIIQLIVGGRADSLMGLLAVADSPIFGKGYWARDTEGYRAQFLAKYGTYEDYEHFNNYMEFLRNNGLELDLGIPCHSHIVSFWVWYGLPGLLFWIYVIYVIFRYIRQDVAIVPQWYYWLAAGVPGLLWHIFFSPFNNRIGLPLTIIAMLLTRAVRLGKYQLPYDMIKEIEDNERR